MNPNNHKPPENSTTTLGQRIYLAVMMLGVCLVIFAIASTTGGVS